MPLLTDVLDRIQLAKAELDAVADLITVNENPDGWPLYKLAAEISGKNVRYKLENLVCHLWSAKDHMSEELRSAGLSRAADMFEKAIHRPKEAHLVQYLANQIKHGVVKRNKRNIYRESQPKIQTPYLFMTNKSAPGPMKPVARIEGDVLGPFQFEGPEFFAGGFRSSGFDTIIVSAKITTADNRTINGAYELCAQFSKLLLETFENAKSGCA